MPFETLMPLCVFVGIYPGRGTPEGIAFDWINRRIYYSDYSNQTIYSMAEDGSQRTVIAHVSKPRAIVLDPCRGYVMVLFIIFLYVYFWKGWGLKLCYVHSQYFMGLKLCSFMFKSEKTQAVLNGK